MKALYLAGFLKTDTACCLQLLLFIDAVQSTTARSHGILRREDDERHSQNVTASERRFGKWISDCSSPFPLRAWSSSSSSNVSHMPYQYFSQSCCPTKANIYLYSTPESFLTFMLMTAACTSLSFIFYCTYEQCYPTCTLQALRGHTYHPAVET